MRDGWSERPANDDPLLALERVWRASGFLRYVYVHKGVVDVLPSHWLLYHSPLFGKDWSRISSYI